MGIQFRNSKILIRSGEVSTDAGCCDGPCCNYCSGVAPAEWVVDLGVGGIVNGTCDQCSNVQGEYVLPVIRSPSCDWYYGDEICPGACIFNIHLEVKRTSATKWRIEASVGIGALHVGTNDVEWWASAEFDWGDSCMDPVNPGTGKVQLSSFYVSDSDACCVSVAALPNTIYAWPY